ncbi:MAG: hypothetical protein RL272_169 [Candidatus Parcubacteria bacterium]|jgi:spermidine synthase
MSWLFEPSRPVETKHNGTMRLSRLLGAWRLKGLDGTEQSTPYMDALWSKVLSRVASRGLVVRRCLVLGVAMGGTLGLVRRRWPDAALVGVDWEPALFRLGLDLGIFRPSADVRFIEGDAAAVVPGLDGAFDLVLVDMFFGRTVARAVSDAAFQDAVVAHLAPGGVVAVNRFDQPDVLAGWRARLGEASEVHYGGNRIGIFVRGE